jgi:hypothetical protein
MSWSSMWPMDTQNSRLRQPKTSKKDSQLWISSLVQLPLDKAHRISSGTEPTVSVAESEMEASALPESLPEAEFLNFLL